MGRTVHPRKNSPDSLFKLEERPDPSADASPLGFFPPRHRDDAIYAPPRAAPVHGQAKGVLVCKTSVTEIPSSLSPIPGLVCES